jgi:hypothetical protein
MPDVQEHEGIGAGRKLYNADFEEELTVDAGSP